MKGILFNHSKSLNPTFDIRNKSGHIPTMEFISPLNKKTNKKLIVMIRGHVRDSFGDPRLRQLIESLSQKYNTTIYLHTWDILQSDKSWRTLEKNNTPVSQEMIQEYFKGIPIKRIQIETEENIELNGTIEGNVSVTRCPVLCWKNMFYGMYEIIKNIDEPAETTILNIRYDIFTNRNRLFTIDSIMKLIDLNFNKYMYSNAYISKEPKIGIDNLILGSVYSMRQLIHHFHYNLDEILTRYPEEIHQEFIVFKENKLL